MENSISKTEDEGNHLGAGRNNKREACLLCINEMLELRVGFVTLGLFCRHTLDQKSHMNRSIVKGDCDFFFLIMRNKVMCEERAELYFIWQ